MQEVILMSTTGQVVYKQSADSKNVQINTTGFAAGVYNLQIKSGETTINKKVVVK